MGPRASATPPSSRWPGRATAGLAEYILATLLLLTSAGMAAYWADFWTGGQVHVVEADWYLRFQKAFTLADAWAAACCALGGVGLAAGRRSGPFFALVAGASLVFLALMDIAFNVQNGLYPLAREHGAMLAEVFINAWTLALGVALLLILYPRPAPASGSGRTGEPSPSVFG